MAGATEIRRSPPFMVADDAVDVRFELAPPLRLQGETIDASRLTDSEAAEIRVQAIVDWDAIKEAAGISGPFRVVLISRCRDTRWSDGQALEPVEPREDCPRYRTLLRLGRGDVRGSADCEVQVLLPDLIENADSSRAHNAGSVISRQGFKVRFDRGGFEFPTQWVSFRANHYPDHALWLLNVGGEGWTGEPYDTVEIRLNQDNAAFQRLLVSPRREEQRVADSMYRQIAYDCLATLVSEYLLSEGINEGIEPDGTRLCDVVARLIERRFDDELDELQRLAKESPSMLRLRVQHAMALGQSLS